MGAIIATASFRRSDTKEMVRSGEVIYNYSESYVKELVRGGLARECSVNMVAPETKTLNFPLAGASPSSALPPVPALPQTTAKPLDAGAALKTKPGRKKKLS